MVPVNLKILLRKSLLTSKVYPIVLRSLYSALY
nr:MAG TPA: hypothetical protein [Caudoviricetes sp.]